MQKSAISILLTFLVEKEKVGKGRRRIEGTDEFGVSEFCCWEESKEVSNGSEDVPLKAAGRGV